MKDRHGNEWVLVPREATAQMRAAISTTKIELPITDEWLNQYAISLYRNAIAAAPKFDAVEVDDAMCERICAEYQRLESNTRITGSRNVTAFGRDMIAAVRAELGQTLGLVTRDELAARVEAAYREARLDADTGEPDWLQNAEQDWLNSNARKQLGAK